MAFNLVQSNHNAGTTVALTGITAGNLIVVWANWEEGSGSATISDGTSSLAMDTASDSGGQVMGQFGYLLSANSGNKTFTGTFPAGAAYHSMIAWEFSYTGSATIGFDTSARAGGNSTAPSSGNATVANMDTVVLGGEVNYGAAAASGRKINAIDATGSVTSTRNGTSWYKMFSSTFTGPAVATIASNYWACNIISFKATSVGGGLSFQIGLEIPAGMGRGLSRGTIRKYGMGD